MTKIIFVNFSKFHELFTLQVISEHEITIVNGSGRFLQALDSKRETTECGKSVGVIPFDFLIVSLHPSMNYSTYCCFKDRRKIAKVLKF